VRWTFLSYMCKTFPPVYNSAKIIKNLSRFSRVMITNVLPPFYGSQCSLSISNTYWNTCDVFCILYLKRIQNVFCILYKYKINCIYVFQIHINKFKYLYAIFMTFTFVSGILGKVVNVCWGLLTSQKQLPYFKMGNKLSDNMFETLLLLKANAHINCVGYCNF